MRTIIAHQARKCLGPHNVQSARDVVATAGLQKVEVETIESVSQRRYACVLIERNCYRSPVTESSITT